jgi:REP element-mobilizing transposase RayT
MIKMDERSRQCAWIFLCQIEKVPGTFKEMPGTPQGEDEMGRVPRVYIEGILYYVTSSGGYNENIFLDPADYDEYITLVANYKNQYGFKIFSYVLLPNHLHMLIELKNNVGISNIMHDINSRYTKAFNSRYGKKGHLFQERFRTLFAEKEPYLLPLARYIHLNPKRLKLVDEIKDYPYSSYAQFLDPARSMYPDMRGEIEEVFNALKGREKAFEEYVNKATPDEINEFKKDLRKKGVLGSRAFSERVKQTIKEETKKQQEKSRTLLRRKHVVYLSAISGTAILVSTVFAIYFYRQQIRFKNKYDQAFSVYLDTLEMLKRERDEALKANRNIEEYVWKIRVAEQALEDFKKEKEREKKETLRAEKALDGYEWKIGLKQIGGETATFLDSDIIYFENNRMNSVNLGQKDFLASNYSKTEDAKGVVTWETIQMNKIGETATWRGEWDGKVMKGVFRRRSVYGVVSDFSFESAGERVKR